MYYSFVRCYHWGKLGRVEEIMCIISYNCVSVIISKKYNLKSGGEREDGRGVNGSHTDLLPGPNWNYNSIVEKPPRTNN